jgi:NADP-dependent 3-hydroxy acid dehydrogenase YdfG
MNKEFQMPNIKGKVVAVTGASSGIGEATARILANAGAHVVIGARRIERLEKLAQEIARNGGTVLTSKLDVTSRDDVERFTKLAVSNFGRLDVIVNNAGVMPLSPLSSLKVDEWERMVDVNIKGVLYGIAAALPIMSEQGSGQIINVSSIGGHSVSPTAAVYCATKFAVGAISDGLRQETDKIRVTVISPGTTTSELADTISDPVARDAMKSFRAVTISPEAIGNSILYAISQPDDVDVSEIIIRPTASPH